MVGADEPRSFLDFGVLDWLKHHLNLALLGDKRDKNKALNIIFNNHHT